MQDYLRGTLPNNLPHAVAKFFFFRSLYSYLFHQGMIIKGFNNLPGTLWSARTNVSAEMMSLEPTTISSSRGTLPFPPPHPAVPPCATTPAPCGWSQASSSCTTAVTASSLQLYNVSFVSRAVLLWGELQIVWNNIRVCFYYNKRPHGEL